MRILQLSHYFPPETFGGTQGYVAGLSLLLKEAGHEVLVVAGARIPSPGGEMSRTEERGITVIRILRDLPGEALTGDLGSERIGKRIQEIAGDFRPDLVHLHHWHALTRDLVRRLKHEGHKVVLTLHDLFSSCPRFFRMPDARRFCDRYVGFGDCARCVSPDLPSIPTRELEGILEERFEAFQAEIGTADAVLAVSRSQKAFLQDLPGFRFGELRVLPIGIRIQGKAPEPPEPVPGKLRLVNWAGLDPRKGIHLILEAVAGSDRREAFGIHLHGREGDRDYMEELRRKGEGLELYFHGSFEDEERWTFSGRYDLAVFPFLAFETYGLVVDEALHSGLPVLVSDHGAPLERIGSRGRSFACGEVGSLQRALEELLQEPRRLVGLRKGEHGAREIDWHVGELMKLYREVDRKTS